MKNTIILLLFAFILLPWNTRGEVIQLLNVSSESKADTLPKYSDEQLADIQDIKNLLVNFIKAANISRYELLSSKYKKTFKDFRQELSSALNKEAYSKIDIRRLENFSTRKAALKVNLYWENEGYSGIQTFYFMFAKEKNQWLIDWLVY